MTKQPLARAVCRGAAPRTRSKVGHSTAPLSEADAARKQLITDWLLDVIAEGLR